MLLVGLTGGIGSGKSTVAAMLADRGAVIVAADDLVSEIQQSGGPAHDAILERFGAAVLTRDGALDRQALAGITNDEDARAELRALTYPHLDKAIADRISAERDTDHVVVLDIIPRLAQGGREAYDFAAIIVVDVPVDESVRRLAADRGIAAEVASARIAAQMPREQRRALGDAIIDNSGPLDDLVSQVDTIWSWLLTLRDQDPT